MYLLILERIGRGEGKGEEEREKERDKDTSISSLPYTPQPGIQRAT